MGEHGEPKPAGEAGERVPRAPPGQEAADGAGDHTPGTGRQRPPKRVAVHPETVRRIERSMGALGTAAIAAMDERLPRFRKMSAENRSWLGLVAQAGIAALPGSVQHPAPRGRAG